MKRRYRLYLETSFWKRLGDPRLDERRRDSYRFLRALAGGRHRILISRLVTRELDETPDWAERRKIYRRLWSRGARMITFNPRIVRIATDLRTLGRWRRNLIADLMHIGYAISGAADALVTWDRDDLARDATRRVVQAYGRREDVGVPLIGTPEEVAEWLGIRIA